MIYTIPQKSSNRGSLHDLASLFWDRDIEFGSRHKYAVVQAAYYGGKGYTTHRTAEAAAKASKVVADYSHRVIDTKGREYIVIDGQYGPSLVQA